MRLPGRVIGLLKEYMHDLVEQAKQDEAASQSFGYASPPYNTDLAISDLLAILDDRIESEGVQVGLHIEFLHQMWTLCDQARAHIIETVWLEQKLVDEKVAFKSAQLQEWNKTAVIEGLLNMESRKGMSDKSSYSK